MSENLIDRPPIVVIMGHIDHGKTTLLDYIRNSKIASKESGNITQHIGAYEITLEHENQQKRITFLDTPGHEAFVSIRSRGANLADIAILIIAADEGIMPQTKEALFHIKAAKIPYIIAINKIDKQGINLEKLKNDLAKEEIYLEGRGGNIPYVEISAKTGQNVNQLLELILLIAEMNELKGNPDQNAEGIVIESKIDSKRGICATLIITNGTIHINDTIHIENYENKIKILEDFQGNTIQKATFSSPVLVVGFEKLPSPGAKFICNELTAEQKQLLTQNTTQYKTKLVGDNQDIIIPVVIKADYVGSCEALEIALDGLSKELNVSFNIIQNNVGEICENDLKSINDKITTYLIGFRVKIAQSLINYIRNKPIKIILGETIYQILDQIKNDILLKNAPTQPTKTASLKVLAIFNDVKDDHLIGGEIIEGEIYLKDTFKIFRVINDIVQEIGSGQIKNIQCQKQNVPHIGAPNQCGILVSSNTTFQQGDILEFYK